MEEGVAPFLPCSTTSLQKPYVSFASAGTRGLAYLGFFDCLERHASEADRRAWRENLRGVAGTSAGSICALAFALDLTKDMLHEMTELIDVSNMLKRSDIAMLATEFGIDDGQAIRDAVQQMLIKGGLSPFSTLGDLGRLLRIRFVCATTDLHTSRTVELSSTETPDVLVTDAVFASCAVPFVFRPWRHNGMLLGDGCLTCVLPNPFPPAETLFVAPVTSEPERLPLNGWSSFLQSIVRCATQPQMTSFIVTPPEGVEVLRLDIPPHVSQQASTFDLSMGDDAKASLSGCGYVSTLDHLMEGRVSATMRRLLQAFFAFASFAVSDELPPRAL